MLAVNAASMKFFRVVSCFSLFKKDFSVSSITDRLQKALQLLGTEPFFLAFCWLDITLLSMAEFIAIKESRHAGR